MNQNFLEQNSEGLRQPSTQAPKSVGSSRISESYAPHDAQITNNDRLKKKIERRERKMTIESNSDYPSVVTV